MDNWKYRRKAISPESNWASTALTWIGKKTKGSKLLTIEKAKNDAHLHKRYHGWDNGAKQRLEKSRYKVNKKGGEPVCKREKVAP